MWVFFFSSRRRHTRCGRDWSSDVCSSDLADALVMARSHRGPLHMLVTDVVMPGMNGRTLADRLLEDAPKLKCLFMSGYTDDVISTGGMLDQNVHFLQKPFSPRALADKVRQVLEG